MDKVVKNSIYLSLLLQIITTLIPFDGFSVKLQEKDKVLQGILSIETFVQVVEMMFYIWIVFAIKDLKSVTPRRYIDWSITTPVMLFTTIVFLKYSELKEKNQKKNLTIKSFLVDNKENVIKLVIYNALMLLFGFLGETGILNKTVSVTIGFVFFFLAFNLIYQEYAKHSKEGIKLFLFVFIVWLLYGVAALAPLKIKNISYNMLDIVSKNFYGLFIYYKIKKLEIK